MSIWSLFKKKPAEDATTPAPPPETRAPSTPPPRNEIDRLADLGEPNGATVEEALATLGSLRASPDEGRAIDVLLRRARAHRLPDAIAVAAAAALVARGEPALAVRALEGTASTTALVMCADLAAEAGDLPRGLALIERVMLRDLDHPGARERHARWRAQLGYGAAAKKIDAGATTVVGREPDAPFDLLREVARGGAGAVYESIDRDLKRRVALKVYHQPERDKEQLAHEARVATQFQGVGVVRIFDADPEHGWIALEWAKLGTVRDFIRAKDTRLLPVARWALPLATALARVHAAGWVHHDVKPANVLLAADDMPLLTDFGIARRAGEPSPAGSMGYMSPERLAGRASDPKDDVYGFGRVLEDVLDALPSANDPRARAIAQTCTGADAGRPPDARALVTRLRVELAAG